ncbi:MAG: homoserine kinase, partial [Rikenellaceae bacterium]
RLEKKILPGSGIGSSAAAAAAAVFAYNELTNSNFSTNELIVFALEGECMASGSKHADNVAPALMGGIVLVRDYDPIDTIHMTPARDIYCAVVHPHIEVKTIDSRAVLQPSLPLSVAVRQWANLGSMVASILIGDFELMSRSLKDLVAEPYRKKFIPGYDVLKDKIMQAGAIGTNISGSGPSVFALCNSAVSAKEVSEVMMIHFTELGIKCDSYHSKISQQGTRLIS